MSILGQPPRPAILLVMTQSLQYGPVRPLFAIAGNLTGLLLLSTCSVLGLSTLIMYSALAFTAVKVIGAGYLVYLGVNLWRKGLSISLSDDQGESRKHGLHLYIQGLLVAATNPKALVFTMALFPQFINISGSLLPQFTIMVTTLMFFSFSCLLFYSLLAHHIKGRCQSWLTSPFSGKIFGSTFMGAGTLLALAGHR
ncbi:LysE family translocator [Endozoicomonas numazuensis]|uniref:LysE family translocator n=1 Tax=Endozoicomonas numazuensis TaxID=1137799 RepID=UPI00069107FC|nr:LysE family translocator [Endozoicomonas numazuensis]